MSICYNGKHEKESNGILIDPKIQMSGDMK